MKKLLCCIILLIFIAMSGQTQTNGNLNVSVSTNAAGGPFAPCHMLAIWIENDSGEFIKSLMVYGNYHLSYLTNWGNSTSAADQYNNTTDALTGATPIQHTTRNCLWNSTDYNGVPVPDGTYKVCMELTDYNNTGNYAEFLFTKSDTPEILNPTNQNSFCSVVLQWNNESDIQTENKVDINVYPNPTRDKLQIETNFPEPGFSLSLYNNSGRLLGSYTLNNQTCILNVMDLPSGVYYLKIKSETNEVYVSRFIKQ